MNPLLGRWISADPLAVHSPGEADFKLYAYVTGRILKNVDPLGLNGECACSQDEANGEQTGAHPASETYVDKWDSASYNAETREIELSFKDGTTTKIGIERISDQTLSDEALENAFKEGKNQDGVYVPTVLNEQTAINLHRYKEEIVAWEKANATGEMGADAAKAFIPIVFMYAGQGVRVNGPKANAGTSKAAQRLARNRAEKSAVARRVAQGRANYEAEVLALKEGVAKLKKRGINKESVARWAHAMRRMIGEKYKNLTPKARLEKIYERNLKKYGDKLGPSVEWLRKKGKSWDDIIDSATRPGGADLAKTIGKK